LVKPLDPEVVKAKVAVFVELFRKARRIKEQEEELRRIERRRSEAELSEREREFEATFHEAAVGIAQLSLEGRIVRCNQRLASILGNACADVATLRVEDVVHPEALDGARRAMRQLLAGEEASHTAERRVVRKDGAVAWCRMT